jgi:hypothetical protein
MRQRCFIVGFQHWKNFSSESEKGEGETKSDFVYLCVHIYERLIIKLNGLLKRTSFEMNPVFMDLKSV